VRHSTDRILATHVGSLPELVRLDPAATDYDRILQEGVAAVVAKQRELGIDFINEGEYTKGGTWISYVGDRFAGLAERPRNSASDVLRGKDREEFAEFYAHATATGTLFFSSPLAKGVRSSNWVCTGPIAYKGHSLLKREISLLQACLAPEEGFLTTTAPSSLEPHVENEFYRGAEELLHALGEAMRVEYEAIAAAGFDVQVDDAWLAALWDRIGIPMGLNAYRRYCELRIEVLNHALRNVPEEKVRYHLCWGSWHGPHVHDIGMDVMIDLMLRVKAGAYSFEAANARHEHEYALWERVRLPEGKLILPGVITHSTNVVEHPELVSQRIRRFARLVGRENVIASADCGFGGRAHPQIAWAKLRALTEGARAASRALEFPGSHEP